METILTSHTNWSLGPRGLILNTPFPYCDTKRVVRKFCVWWYEDNAIEFIALYGRPWLYKLFKKT